MPDSDYETDCWTISFDCILCKFPLISKQLKLHSTRGKLSSKQMTKETKNRIECALVNMLNEVDKQHLRHLQAEMHKCAAKCCEDRESSVELVHNCIQICSQNLKRAQKVVQSEFIHLQKSLQGCALTCNDEAKQKLGNYPLDQQIQLYSSTFDKCIDDCIDSNIALIPMIMKKMKEVLAKQSPETVQAAK